MKEKKFVIGEDSERYLNALDTFQTFKNTLLQALETEFGEEQANEMFLKNEGIFEAVENSVMGYLRDCMVIEMGTDKEIVTI